MNRHLAFNLSLLVLVIGIFSFALIYIPRIPQFKHLVVDATSVKPVGFTELYFENSAFLPTTFDVLKPVTFSFAIQNRENQPKTYHYEIFSESQSKNTLVDFQNVSIPNGEKKLITVTLKPTQKFRTKVTVHIANLHQIISFWMEPSK